MTNRIINYKSKDYKTGYKNGKSFYKKKYEGEIESLKQEGSTIITSLRKDLIDAEKGTKIMIIILTTLLILSIGFNTYLLIK